MFRLPPKRRPQSTAPDAMLQQCEQRLVLSAQLLFDVLGDQALANQMVGDQALQTHGSLNSTLAVDSDTTNTQVQLQASAAHNLTGWTQAHQQFGLTGKGQTVAVIDSGIAWDHVALGKGFGAGYRVVGGWDFTEENDANPYDDGPAGYHGTHVAGIIGSDDATRTGVAPDVDLVALRVFNDLGKGQMEWVEKALQWVHTNKDNFENPITTVNLSIGSTWNSSNVPNWAILEDELRTLHNDGILVTASAGNSFKSYNAPGLSYPAASQYVLPVASVDDNGQLSDFSQRDDRVIAAPGRNILSTVPDHLLGRDGRVNDFSLATGTSMASPYVAGASVLVRQAMEMAGWNNITVDSIVDHLHNTADTIFDSVTQASYERLDLQNALDAIIPDDNIGDTSAAAQTIDLSSGGLSGWINSLQDDDVFRFTAARSGSLRLDANSDWLDSLQWSISSNGQILESGDLNAESLALVAGRTYEIRLTAGDEIGTYQLGWTFQADSSGGEGGNAQPATSIGSIDYWENQVNAGGKYRAQATEDGTFTVQWNNPDSPTGRLTVTPVGGSSLNDATWENGSLRLDIDAKAGQWFEIQLPGSASDQGELAIANVLSRSGRELQIDGTAGHDELAISLQNGLTVTFGSIQYQFGANQIDLLQMDAEGDSDTLNIQGSSQAERVTLTSNATTIDAGAMSIRILNAEEVSFRGNGGADSAYLYDTNGNDTLNLRPQQADMVGAGYRFNVVDTDRIFIHATAGGQDIGYLYDSAGDDRLSVRPQFSSMSGNGYYNYISGVERLYAYATAGGFDTADLYDSAGNDRFATTGESASITGPGFASYTKFFDQVDAYASAGGNDTAALYGSGSTTQWQRGADFISFSENPWSREARGFDAVDTFIAGQLQSLTWNGATTQQSVGASIPTVESAIQSAVSSQSEDFGTEASHDGQAAREQLAVSFMAPVAESTTAPWSSAFDESGFEVMDAVEGAAISPRAALPIEDLLLVETQQLQDWVKERLEDTFDSFVQDRNVERQVLDELFRQLDEEALF